MGIGIVALSVDAEKYAQKSVDKHSLTFPVVYGLDGPSESSKIGAFIDEEKGFFHATNFLFLGRGSMYPIAMEGALKLKEISYIHAEGYAAGEMKHGPIALIDENMPVLVIANQSAVYDKVISNLEEVRAREGQVIALATEGDERISEKADAVMRMPAVSELLEPIVATIPLQLLAYHIATLKGTDVDQPRNLAKSVTVE